MKLNFPHADCECKYVVIAVVALCFTRLLFTNSIFIFTDHISRLLFTNSIFVSTDHISRLQTDSFRASQQKRLDSTYSPSLSPTGTKGPYWNTPYCQELFINNTQIPMQLEPGGPTEFLSGQFRQDMFVFNNFFRDTKKMFNGFFIESGAAGIPHSMTLFYERCLGWEGLCVEPTEAWYPELEAGRTCTLVKGCIGEESDDTFVIEGVGETSHLVKSDGGMKCMSLRQILDTYAEGRRHVDFWSLDVEGHELSVLESVDFSEIDVTALLIEDMHLDHRALSYAMTKNQMVLYYQLASGDSVWVNRQSMIPEVKYVDAREDATYKYIYENYFAPKSESNKVEQSKE